MPVPPEAGMLVVAGSQSRAWSWSAALTSLKKMSGQLLWLCKTKGCLSRTGAPCQPWHACWQTTPASIRPTRQMACGRRLPSPLCPCQLPPCSPESRQASLSSAYMMPRRGSCVSCTAFLSRTWPVGGSSHAVCACLRSRISAGSLVCMHVVIKTCVLSSQHNNLPSEASRSRSHGAAASDCHAGFTLLAIGLYSLDIEPACVAPLLLASYIADIPEQAREDRGRVGVGEKGGEGGGGGERGQERCSRR